MTKIHTRLVTRTSPYKEVSVQVMNDWSGRKCPKYMVCNDQRTGEIFLAEQRMGAWMEVDLDLLARSLNNIFWSEDISMKDKILENSYLNFHKREV